MEQQVKSEVLMTTMMCWRTSISQLTRDGYMRKKKYYDQSDHYILVLTHSLTYSLAHLLTRSLTHSLAFLGIDDDEFEENDGSFTIGKKSAILSYYDPLKKKGPALVLDDTGIVAGSNKSNGNEFNYTDNESLVVGGPQRKPQSLQVTKSESSDYYNKVRTHLPRSHSLTHLLLTHSLTHSLLLTHSLTHSGRV
jgi:hypothetical protein